MVCLGPKYEVAHALFRVIPLMDCERLAKHLIPLMAYKGVAEEFIRQLFVLEVENTSQVKAH